MTTKLLKMEIDMPWVGECGSEVLKCQGYKKNYLADSLSASANAIESLFLRSNPHVYKNDWIAGSMRSIWLDTDERELEYANSVCESYGKRDFLHNRDHFAPDYDKIVRLGICGLREEIERAESIRKQEKEKMDFLAATKRALSAFEGMIAGYANRARALQGVEGYDNKKLQFIVDNCENLLRRAPQTFAEGLQLVWFCHVAFTYEGRSAMALARIDQYLYPLYERDISSGKITREFAVTLLENAFLKIYEHHACGHEDDTVNICIGGTNLDGSSAINELSYCVLEAVKNCKVAGPNLSARIPKDVPDKFLDECLKVIGTGLGYPALMNDEVNIAALLRYGYEKEDVYNYSMVGCIENFITGKQPAWTDDRFDAPRFFEYIFNDGKGIVHPSIGEKSCPLEEITSMEKFMQVYEEQLAWGAKEYYMFFANENDRLNVKRYPSLFLSLFCDGCVEKGRDINDGGSKYPTVHGVALMGIGTVCDSLAAIEKVIFEEKAATLQELASAIKANFEGYEELHKKLLEAPKYGNNDDYVDKYAVWFVDYLAKVFTCFKTKDGGPYYVAMAANTANILAGEILAATPDGRKAREPLSDAASPTYGRDIGGATLTVNSITKPDYTQVACGTVINQKFSPSMFEDGKREKLLALLKVYFKKGGQEMQINATSRKVLLDAMERPELYGDLVVRVSGFSAFYVTLSKDVQLDILNRTQQE